MATRDVFLSNHPLHFIFPPPILWFFFSSLSPITAEIVDQISPNREASALSPKPIKGHTDAAFPT